MGEASIITIEIMAQMFLFVCFLFGLADQVFSAAIQVGLNLRDDGMAADLGGLDSPMAFQAAPQMQQMMQQAPQMQQMPQMPQMPQMQQMQQMPQMPQQMPVENMQSATPQMQQQQMQQQQMQPMEQQVQQPMMQQMP